MVKAQIRGDLVASDHSSAMDDVSEGVVAMTDRQHRPGVLYCI